MFGGFHPVPFRTGWVTVLHFCFIIVLLDDVKMCSNTGLDNTAGTCAKKTKQTNKNQPPQ